MKDEQGERMNRRDLLTRTAPACAMACLGLSRVPEVLAAAQQVEGQEVHKFDVTRNVELSPKGRTQLENYAFFEFIRNVRAEVGDEEMLAC